MMSSVTTEAWVLHPGPASNPTRASLSRERISFPGPEADEVLVEPLYGSWEANIDHALSRDPVDVCRQRNEDTVILGNWAVVRVLAHGADANHYQEGDLCLVLPFGVCDRFGYAELVYGYDSPGTLGVLARRTKLKEHLLLPLPPESRHTLLQWAASCRCFVAWDNWRVAYSVWRAQMRDADPRDELVFAWGGGVALAELQLARQAGFRVAMTASTDDRLELLRKDGIIAVDRRSFAGLRSGAGVGAAGVGAARVGGDRVGGDRGPEYREAERKFLDTIGEISSGRRVSIFIDNIGAPLYKATLKALSRQGVVTTAGWKLGMRTDHLRAISCINRQLFVNTHVWRYHDSEEIMNYLECDGWMPHTPQESVYGFESVPELAQDYAAQRVASYFPIFQVNPL